MLACSLSAPPPGYHYLVWYQVTTLSPSPLLPLPCMVSGDHSQPLPLVTITLYGISGDHSQPLPLVTITLYGISW